MAKKKKLLMIPFSYGDENMQSYCDYSYEEGTKNSNVIWWDALENKQVNDWVHKPEEFNHWTKDPNHNYLNQLFEYQEKLIEIQERKDSLRYTQVESIVWKENFEFEDTLYLEGMSRGRSAANFNLVSQIDNKSYNLFMTDILNMVQNADIHKGIIKGKWTFCKRGSNYGVKLLKQTVD